MKIVVVMINNTYCKSYILSLFKDRVGRSGRDLPLEHYKDDIPLIFKE